MGMELMGFAVPNLEDLWIDPYDYSRGIVHSNELLGKPGYERFNL